MPIEKILSLAVVPANYHDMRAHAPAPVSCPSEGDSGVECLATKMKARVKVPPRMVTKSDGQKLDEEALKVETII